MNKLLKVNPFLLVSAFVISVIGILTLISTESTSTLPFNVTEISVKQIIFVFIGILLFIGLSRFDSTYLKYRPIIVSFYVLTLVLLLLTLFIGEQRNNATRWISVAGVQLQPSEIAKLTVILTTTFIMNMERGLNKYLYVLISFLAIIPILFLIFLQPHGSMTLIIVVLWAFSVFISMKNQIRNLLLLLVFGLLSIGLYAILSGNSSFGIPLLLGTFATTVFLFFARDSWKVPLILISVLGLIFGFLVTHTWNNVLLPYQKERINVFINPDLDDQNASFNVNQAKIAIGSGQLWGKGWAKGTQGERDFLPEHQTDFIFASYAEEFGLVGSLILIGLYVILVFGIFLAPIKYSFNSFFSVIIVAIGFKILLETFINLGTNTGITPATGIPLPMMSAGGTITIMTFFSLGIIQSIINSQVVDI